VQPIARGQYRDRAKPVQTPGAAGDPAIADRTACAPQPGATDANPTIASGDREGMVRAELYDMLIRGLIEVLQLSDHPWQHRFR